MESELRIASQRMEIFRRFFLCTRYVLYCRVLRTDYLQETDNIIYEIDTVASVQGQTGLHSNLIWKVDIRVPDKTCTTAGMEGMTTSVKIET